MSAKIIVACGSGVATSRTVASKVQRLLEQRDLKADVKAVEIKDLRFHIRRADIYIAVVKSDEKYPIPVLNGIAFLTGIGQNEELAKLVSLVQAKQ